MVEDLITSGALEVNDGYRAKNSELGSAAGLPFARAGNLKNGFDFGEADRVRPERFGRVGSKRSLPGDVAFTSKGTVGRFAFVTDDVEPFVYSPQLCFWRSLDPASLDSRFLFYWMQGPAMRAQLDAAKGLTDMADYVSLRDQRKMRIDVPPVVEQGAIAEILGALDDKIESNRRTANAARAVLMQAPPSTGELSPLDQAAGFYNGGALTKHATGSGRPILRIKELRAGVTADTPRTDAPVRETHEVASGDLLFSWSGTLLTTRWCGEPAVLNQHVFRVDPLPGLSRWFVEAWIERHLDPFRAIAADKATTMGHIQRHHLSEALVALPPRDETDALIRTYDPLDQLRMSLLDEAERLAAIRDALLPRLVSGRLRAPVADDLDKAIETVLATVQQSKRQHSAASNGVQASPPVRLNGTRPVDVAP